MDGKEEDRLIMQLTIKKNSKIGQLFIVWMDKHVKLGHNKKYRKNTVMIKTDEHLLDEYGNQYSS